VQVEVVTRRSISEHIQGNGTLEAENEVDLVARIAGPITALEVEEGDTVVAGQLLARIDDREARNRVSIATVARDEAQLAFDRARTTAEKGLVSHEAYDSAQSDLEAAAAQLETSTIQLAYTEIRAPFDSLVVVRHIKLAQYVNPGEALFRVRDGGVVSRREVRLGIREEDVVEIVEGISEGEQIVVLGQEGLADGTPVTVLDEQMATPRPGSPPDEQQINEIRAKMRAGGMSEEQIDARIQQMQQKGGGAEGMPQFMEQRIRDASPEELEGIKKRMRERRHRPGRLRQPAAAIGDGKSRGTQARRQRTPASDSHDRGHDRVRTPADGSRARRRSGASNSHGTDGDRRHDHLDHVDAACGTCGVLDFGSRRVTPSRPGYEAVPRRENVIAS
jgi:biotin carboxyl carrier protein